MWRIIKTAVEEDHETAEALIAATGTLMLPNNSLTLIVDDEELYYRVPICVINDPLNYDADYVNQQLREKKAPMKEEVYKVSFSGSEYHGV